MTSLNNQSESIIIALDGYSSCGKSTFAKAIAARLGYIFIDTGAMYRAVTHASICGGALSEQGEISTQRVVELLPQLSITFRFNPERGASDIYVDGVRVEDEIRSLEVSSYVSCVSSIGDVRTKLVAMQQEMGSKGGVVMDGRDIGTVVFPEAQIKIFMTADAHIRAERRYQELTAKGERVSLEEIETNIRQRDLLDESREISPLKRADDALLLDNSHMSVEEQMEWFLEIFNKVQGSSKI